MGLKAICATAARLSGFCITIALLLSPAVPAWGGSGPQPLFSFVSGVKSGGEDVSQTSGTYGIKGVASRENNPGARDSAITWKDNQGRFWLFGGKSALPERSGVFNDVWMYDPSLHMWTWVHGSNSTNASPVEGPEGEFSAAYTPGDLISASSWVDKDGCLWVYGGNNTENELFALLGYNATGNLWKFDVRLRQWGLIRVPEQRGAQFGTQGVAAEANWPGSRQWATTWVDDQGKFWLFGGWGFTRNFGGDRSDLWVYDPVAGLWTWVNGGTAPNNSGYLNLGYLQDPPLGINPSVREAAHSWVDNAGQFWLFGGRLNIDSQRYYNDLWKYSPSENTWTFVSGTKKEWAPGYYADVPRLTPGVYGQKNSFAAANAPGGRDGAATWKGDDGNFWMFGGYGASEAAGQEGGLADLWKFNPALGQWAWAGGSKQPYVLGRYGTQNKTEPGNYSGGRHSGAIWTGDTGKVWIFGGYGFNIYHEDQLNDLWTLDYKAELWTWIAGNSYPAELGYYGDPLTPHVNNHPGTREGSNLWAPPGQYLWVFGGNGHALNFDISNLGDLWRYDKKSGEWTWIKGVNMLDHEGTYGPKGEAWHTYTPSARRDAMQWTDAAGRLWLFGGQNTKGALNDLWMFDPAINCWMWVSGNSMVNSAGTYGTKGTSAPSNAPAARYAASAWYQPDGSLWLYGGVNANDKTLSDLWKFDIATSAWTWMSGSNIPDQAAVYGSKGVAATGNIPGYSKDSVAWADKSQNLWLYGGENRSDLWKYQIAANTWTWVSGPGTQGAVMPVFGPAAVLSDTAHPGSRFSACAWADLAGNLWMFGGKLTADDERNDLWLYAPMLNQWAFIKGPHTARELGVYGPSGSFISTNLPGARANAAATTDNQGNMWLYGGYGFDVRPGTRRLQGDIWLLDSQHVTAAQDWALYE